MPEHHKTVMEHTITSTKIHSRFGLNIWWGERTMKSRHISERASTLIFIFILLVRSYIEEILMSELEFYKNRSTMTIDQENASCSVISQPFFFAKEGIMDKSCLVRWCWSQLYTMALSDHRGPLWSGWVCLLPFLTLALALVPVRSLWVSAGRTGAASFGFRACFSPKVSTQKQKKKKQNSRSSPLPWW